MQRQQRRAAEGDEAAHSIAASSRPPAQDEPEREAAKGNSHAGARMGSDCRDENSRKNENSRQSAAGDARCTATSRTGRGGRRRRHREASADGWLSRQADRQRQVGDRQRQAETGRDRQRQAETDRQTETDRIGQSWAGTDTQMDS
jgi:hypothetical protein